MLTVTELLVTGFNDDGVVFATHLTPEVAATILTETDSRGETAVEATSNQATPAYSALVDLLTALLAVSR